MIRNLLIAFITLTCILALAIPATFAQVEAPIDETLKDEGAGTPVFAYVNWPDHNLAQVILRVSLDQEGKQVVVNAQAQTSNGTVFAVLDPGEYYLTAFVDTDCSNRASAGDGVGFYGATDPLSAPVPIIIDEDSGPIEVPINIILEFGLNGKLTPIDIMPVIPIGTGENVIVAGNAGNSAGPIMALLCPSIPLYTSSVVDVDASGNFTFSAPPGAYQLIVFEDRDNSGHLSTGDGVGIGGIIDTNMTELPLIKIEAGVPVNNLPAPIIWTLDGTGRLRTPDGLQRGPAINPMRLPGIVSGVVTQEGKPVENAQVWICSGEDFNPVIAKVVTDATGSYKAALNPGPYYVIAWIDSNDSGVIGPGEPMGRPICAPDISAGPGRVFIRPVTHARNVNVEINEVYPTPATQ